MGCRWLQVQRRGGWAQHNLAAAGLGFERRCNWPLPPSLLQASLLACQSCKPVKLETLTRVFGLFCKLEGDSHREWHFGKRTTPLSRLRRKQTIPSSSIVFYWRSHSRLYNMQIPVHMIILHEKGFWLSWNNVWSLSEAGDKSSNWNNHFPLKNVIVYLVVGIGWDRWDWINACFSLMSLDRTSTTHGCARWLSGWINWRCPLEK